MAGATIPTSIIYPLVRKLGTGEVLTFSEIRQVAELLNWVVGEIYLDPVIEQGLNSGHGEKVSSIATLAQWRVPTLHDAQTDLGMQIELECTTNDATITFTAAGSGASSSIIPVSSAGRNWWNKDLVIDSTADHEDVEIEVDPGTGTVTVYAIRGAFHPLSSPLLTQKYLIEGAGADPAALIPIPLAADPLADADEPLSAGLGRLILRDLEAALTRLKRSYYSLSAWGDISGPISTTHPYLMASPGVLLTHWALSKVRMWPGVVTAGLKARVHALVIPHATNLTRFVLIAECPVPANVQALSPQHAFTRPLFTKPVLADAAQTPVWITGEIELPDDIYQPGRPLPAVRIGVRPSYDIDGPGDRWVSTCGIQTVSVWGVW